MLSFIVFDNDYSTKWVITGKQQNTSMFMSQNANSSAFSKFPKNVFYELLTSLYSFILLTNAILAIFSKREKNQSHKTKATSCSNINTHFDFLSVLAGECWKITQCFENNGMSNNNPTLETRTLRNSYDKNFDSSNNIWIYSANLFQNHYFYLYCLFLKLTILFITSYSVVFFSSSNLYTTFLCGC